MTAEVARRATIAVTDPATGARLGEVALLAAEDVSRIALAARSAQPGWEQAGLEQRAEVLRRAQKWLLRNADRVSETIVSETGKAWEDAQLLELPYVGSALGFWADNAARYLAEQRVRSSTVFVKGKKLLLRYRPLGLVGVIGPWNYPLVNSFGDCIPALAAGNCVILKPSEIAPLTSLLMAEMLRDSGIPDGVFNVATGDGSTGAAVIDEADMIMFTGSTATGKKVMERAARTLTPISLELGGKDPLIVLRDADLERAANAAVYASMQNTGQTCISIERAFVEAPVYEEFVHKVTEKVRALRVGPPAGPGSVEVGALTFEKQLATVESHVEDALNRGARAPVGGARIDGSGLFFQPTVLVDVTPEMKIMREETFGPVLPIMRVRDADEAVTLANDSPYGLSGAVFGGDIARAQAVARQLEAGSVCVNDALINYSALELPMGGAKASGLGTRHGAEGIRKYCAQQAVLVSRFHLKRELHWFPYSALRTRLLMRIFRWLWGRDGR